jgi:hypothetical protein
MAKKVTVASEDGLIEKVGLVWHGTQVGWEGFADLLCCVVTKTVQEYKMSTLQTCITQRCKNLSWHII